MLTTIPEGLVASAADDSQALVFHLKEGVHRLGARELLERVQMMAGWLESRGIGRGSRVGVLGPNRPEWAVSAFSAWWVGAAVVPIQVPLRMRDPQAFQDRLLHTTRAAGCDLVMCDPDLLEAAPSTISHAWTPRSTSSVAAGPAAVAEDIAVIQFTSGSTSTPKGVVLTHAAVIAQISQYMAEDDPCYLPDDQLAGWVPFFHDLGLFLFLVHPVVNRLTAHILPTELFARDPSAWLDLIAAQRATITDAPQSAWTAAFDAARRRGRRVDLSSLKCAWFGAEGMDAQGVEELFELCPSIGLDPNALGGSYGLAEAVLCVTATKRREAMRIDILDDPRSPGHRCVSSGPPMAEMSVRIVTEGRHLEDGRLGEIQVAGPCLTSGYLDASVPSPVTDGWLSTGDLGYLRDGELYVTGRIKDLVIVMGQNYYPEDLEWAAARVPGVRPGRCVAFVDGERAVLLVEPREDDAGLAKQVRYAVADAVGLGSLEVNVVPSGTIEKTTSGKLRRSAMRDLYQRGAVVSEYTSS